MPSVHLLLLTEEILMGHFATSDRSALGHHLQPSSLIIDVVQICDTDDTIRSRDQSPSNKNGGIKNRRIIIDYLMASYFFLFSWFAFSH